MQKLCCVRTRQQFSASLVIQKFVPTLLTHISPNSRPFLVGIVSPIIGVFHEYAHLGKGRSIHPDGQMEWFNCQVDDRSKLVGGA